MRTLIMLLVLFPTLAQAEYRFRVDAGWIRSTMTNIGATPDKLEALNRPTFGLGIETPGGHDRLSIFYGVNYTEKGIYGEEFDRTLGAQFSIGFYVRYLELTALAEAELNEQVKLFFGPYFGLKNRCLIKASVETITYEEDCNSAAGNIESEIDKLNRIGLTGGVQLQHKLLHLRAGYSFDLNAIEFDNEKTKHRNLVLKGGLSIPIELD